MTLCRQFKIGPVCIGRNCVKARLYSDWAFERGLADKVTDACTV